MYSVTGAGSPGWATTTTAISTLESASKVWNGKLKKVPARW
jgi:hypothetical protein